MDHTQINMDHIQKNKTGSLALFGGAAALSAAAGGVAGYVAGRGNEIRKNRERLEVLDEHFREFSNDWFMNTWKEKKAQLWGVHADSGISTEFRNKSGGASEAPEFAFRDHSLPLTRDPRRDFGAPNLVGELPSF